MTVDHALVSWRFGLRFIASPRHADVLLVTGPVTKNMREARAHLCCHTGSQLLQGLLALLNENPALDTSRQSSRSPESAQK